MIAADNDATSGIMISRLSDACYELQSCPSSGRRHIEAHTLMPIIDSTISILRLYSLAALDGVDQPIEKSIR